VLFFAGQEFNEQLDKNQELSEDNVIDFSKLANDQGEAIEEKIREICYNAKNQQLISNNEYPIIWFKNIEKIKNNSRLEKSLLSVLDPQQNIKSIYPNLFLFLLVQLIIWASFLCHWFRD
jgi:hypothetical protein